MADITIGNMENNAALFMEKMGFAHDSEGLELTDEQVVNFLLLCMRGVMDEILGSGTPKVSM